MRDASRADDGHADVVDELLLDQLLAVPDRIEHFTDREWRGRVLPYQPERLVVLRGRRVLEPKEAIPFERFSKLPRFDRCEPMMRIVQQVRLEAIRGAQLVEEP